jgi:ribosomal protein L25 (general stress protein Ctc)
MSIDYLYNQNIENLFQSVIYDEKSYIDLTLSGEKPVRVTIKYHFEMPYSNEVIKCEFYKGSYY